MQYGLPGSIDSMRRAFLRPVVLGRGEKLPHGWCCGGVSGKLGYAQALERQAKNALMLIESDGLVAALRQRTDDDGSHVAAAGCEIQSVATVPPMQPARAETQQTSASNRNRAAGRMRRRDAYIGVDRMLNFS